MRENSSRSCDLSVLGFSSSIQIKDFGLQPVTNRFLYSKEDNSPRFPLRLMFDKIIGLLHLSLEFPVCELRPRYPWLTCYEPEDHINDLSAYLLGLPGMNCFSSVGGFSFKDDSILTRVRELGFTRCWRIDPGLDLNVRQESGLFSIETLQEGFNDRAGERICKTYGPADMFIIRHSLEHFYDLAQFFSAVDKILKPEGYLIIEVPDSSRALRLGDCSMLWEEHSVYFTEGSLRRLLAFFGYVVLETVTYAYPLEDSLVVVARRMDDITLKPFGDFNFEEDLSSARRYVEKIDSRRSRILDVVEGLFRTYDGFALLGVGHLSLSFVFNMLKQGSVKYLLDDDRNKNGLYAPVEGLRIDSSGLLYEKLPKICLLGMNPLSHKRVIEKHSEYVAKGGMFLSIFPADHNSIDVFPWRAA